VKECNFAVAKSSIMKPLIVLIASFIISILAIRLVKAKFDFIPAGNLAMVVMLLFTSIGHFAFPKGMAMMLPEFIPFKSAMVYITGIIEILAAVGLLLPGLRVKTAWLLILFFILLLPANIIAAVKQVNIEKGELNGPGLNYLWFRVPLQLLFIGWVYYFSLKEWRTNHE
jgi:uncharacterized membrane protein